MYLDYSQLFIYFNSQFIFHNQTPFMKMKHLKVLMLFGLMLSIFACQDQFQSIEHNAISSDPLDWEISNIPSGTKIPNQYIVVFNDNTRRVIGTRSVGLPYPEKLEVVQEVSHEILREAGVQYLSMERTYAEAVSGFVLQAEAGEIEKLRKHPAISYIEQDEIITLAPPCGTPRGGPCPPPDDGGGGGGGDDGGGGGGGCSTNTQTTPYGIARVKGGKTYTGNARAWIIDTGIQLNHEDLNVSTNGGFTAFSSGPDANFDDKNGHGTHVAGTVAAIDNCVGVIGVAAGATVVPVKVLDRRGSGTISGVIAGVDHVAATAKSGDVANMSLGGGANTSLDDAVKNLGNKGVRVAIAAGNSSAHAGNYSPARATGTNLYTISAMNSSDNWASFSNFGNPPIRYCQPGVSVNSTWINNGYRSISGTSMAAPHMAGLLLLGNIVNNGTVSGDPDGNPDPIAVYGGN